MERIGSTAHRVGNIEFGLELGEVVRRIFTVDFLRFIVLCLFLNLLPPYADNLYKEPVLFPSFRTIIMYRYMRSCFFLR